MITLLNTSILTAYGSYHYSPLELDEVRALLAENEWQSAIGHESTARIISTLLGIPVQVNRFQYYQDPGDSAIVFKLNGRPEEGKILNIEELQAIGFTWGLLERYD